MYFANFPKIVYDFDLTQGTDYRVITDITQNVRLRKQILENISLYDYYDIGEGETPEIISEKIYGTPYYHWVIMLVNQRYDYINDFPLTTLELDSFIRRKYGDDKIHQIHHYVENDVIREGFNILKIKDSPLDGGTIGAFNAGDIIKSNNSGYLARVEEIISTTPTRVTLRVSMREGIFSVNDLVLGVYEDMNAIVEEVTVPTNFKSVSNYEYEFQVNESKRRIKIVDPALIEQLVKEFQDII